MSLKEFKEANTKVCSLCSLGPNANIRGYSKHPIFADVPNEKVDLLVIADRLSPKDNYFGTIVPVSCSEGIILRGLLTINKIKAAYTSIIACPTIANIAIEHINACAIYLFQQISLTDPPAILCLGKRSLNAIGANKKPSVFIGSKERKVYEFYSLNYLEHATMSHVEFYKELLNTITRIADEKKREG